MMKKGEEGAGVRREGDASWSCEWGKAAAVSLND